MMTSNYMKNFGGWRKQSGVSLVELMIAVTIGLILITVIANVYLAGRQSFRDQDESARLQETGRFVLDTISRVVLEAGRADVAPNNTVLTFARLPAAGLAIDGADGAGAAADSLTIRFASATPGELDCLGTGTGGTAAAPVVVTQILAFDGVDNELVCSVNGGAAQPLASNVADFQVTFGVDTTGDGAVDQYVAPSAVNAPATLAVRMCILVTTADNMAPAAQSFVDCNGAVVVAADRRIRRAFSKVVSLRNRLG